MADRLLTPEQGRSVNTFTLRARGEDHEVTLSLPDFTDCSPAVRSIAGDVRASAIRDHLRERGRPPNDNELDVGKVEAVLQAFVDLATTAQEWIDGRTMAGVAPRYRAQIEEISFRADCEPPISFFGPWSRAVGILSTVIMVDAAGYRAVVGLPAVFCVDPVAVGPLTLDPAEVEARGMVMAAACAAARAWKARRAEDGIDASWCLYHGLDNEVVEEGLTEAEARWLAQRRGLAYLSRPTAEASTPILMCSRCRAVVEHAGDHRPWCGLIAALRRDGEDPPEAWADGEERVVDGVSVRREEALALVRPPAAQAVGGAT